MKITREWLGGSEELDLSQPSQWEEFWRGVVQDFDVAVELRDRIKDEGTVTVNEDDPEYIERYTRIDEPVSGTNTRCVHCGMITFIDDEGVLRHDGHEGESCGELSPDTYAERVAVLSVNEFLRMVGPGLGWKN